MNQLTRQEIRIAAVRERIMELEKALEFYEETNNYTENYYVTFDTLQKNRNILDQLIAMMPQPTDYLQ